jgi:tetratricopeptide (TPR) repeat protein
MFELKPLSQAGIPRAMAKAERYRLLGEPQEADSICRDILRTDPDNQEVLIMLLLSITDQFARGADQYMFDAQRVLEKLRGDYERAYYSGIVCERWVKAQLEDGGHCGSASGWFLEALDWYQKAQALSEAGNEDAVLRWNACVRYLEHNPGLLSLEGSAAESGFSDATPSR